jgi:hypothetical protein
MKENIFYLRKKQYIVFETDSHPQFTGFHAILPYNLPRVKRFSAKLYKNEEVRKSAIVVLHRIGTV